MGKVLLLLSNNLDKQRTFLVIVNSDYLSIVLRTSLNPAKKRSKLLNTTP